MLDVPLAMNHHDSPPPPAGAALWDCLELASDLSHLVFRGPAFQMPKKGNEHKRLQATAWEAIFAYLCSTQLCIQGPRRLIAWYPCNSTDLKAHHKPVYLRMTSKRGSCFVSTQDRVESLHLWQALRAVLLSCKAWRSSPPESGQAFRSLF